MSKQKRRVYMFKPEFAEAVRNGQKCQTVRPIDNRPLPQPGWIADLRMWEALPYRSPHQKLKTSTIVDVRRLDLAISGASYLVTLGGMPLDYDLQERFAKADGFVSVSRMFEWFLSTHGLPFSGRAHQWEGEGRMQWP